MIKYIHGSEDSLDVDVIYVFDKIPSFQECRNFCKEDINENRNIITIENGVVTNCFIGTIDEINNGLMDTYALHEQEYPLLITKRLDRDVEWKIIRAIRGIISILSRTSYRPQIKYALTNGWNARLECFQNLDFHILNDENLNKRMNKKDLSKVIAFQIGQSLGLLNGKEFYTKSSVAKEYPKLRPFLYREEANYQILNEYRDILLKEIKNKVDIIEVDKTTILIRNQKFDLKHEKFLEN